jgi:hypothetical protein
MFDPQEACSFADCSMQDHSEVPTADEDWPSLDTILEFQSRVRDRLLQIYADVESGKKTLTRKMARVLFMTFEHEGFHAEVRGVRCPPPRLSSLTLEE